ncbi:MAG: hypothetical protein KC503_37110 [Myxococcales bacterium]|nr:hypothetical protein [Myxococcales bacterium]
MDCCCFIQFELSAAPEAEWVPMGLRDGVCSLRRTAPARYAEMLRNAGVEIDHEAEVDCRCLHNLDASWPNCPLYRKALRGREKRAAR